MPSNDILTKVFWLDAKERVVRTFLQVLVATLPAQVVAQSAIEGNWENLKVLGVQAITAAFAAALSLLWSLVAAKKPGTLSPASSVVVPGEIIGEVVDEPIKDDQPAPEIAEDIADATQEDNLAQQTDKPDEGGEVSQDPNEVIESEVEEVN